MSSFSSGTIVVIPIQLKKINCRYTKPDKMKTIVTSITSFCILISLSVTGQSQQPHYSVLPVTYVSFKASAIQKGVELNWVADNEVNESYFDVERSFDGSNFRSTGIIVRGVNNGVNNSYKAIDNHTALNGKRIAYYRLKETDVTGIITFSDVDMVKLQETETNATLIYPNPFIDNLAIRFSADQNNNGSITVQRSTGQVATAKNVTISKGQNTFQLNGMGSLPKGIYMVQIVVNGQIISHQKITKI
jgi:hypothetical protein